MIDAETGAIVTRTQLIEMITGEGGFQSGGALAPRHTGQPIDLGPLRGELEHGRHPHAHPVPRARAVSRGCVYAGIGGAFSFGPATTSPEGGVVCLGVPGDD